MRTKTIAGIAAVVLAGGIIAALLWPDDTAGDVFAGQPSAGESRAGEGGRVARTGGAGPEMAAKRQLVERDAALTARLCALQCGADLAKMAGELSGLPADKVPQRLGELRAGHPRMVQLSWVDRGGSPILSGGLPAALEKQLEPRLREAERAVETGKTYDYGPIGADGEHFAVIGVPGRDGTGIVGVVRQSITGKVKKMQTENLRLVPYPREGRYQIESVDSRTGRDITVDHVEENGIASHYHKQEVVVRFAAQPDAGELERISRDLAISEMRKTGYAYVFQSERSTAEEMIDYFRKSDNVIYAEPHYLYMTNGTPGGKKPNDVLFEPYQWNLPIIDTIPGWAISTGHEDVIVAVVDTGVDLEHDDLRGRLAEGMNFVSPGDAPSDDVGHGTHVAGVISAVVNNAEGVAGMTWHDRVMPIKVLDATGAGSAYAVAQGIIWATDNGARVINLSLGNYAESEFLHDAVRYAYDHDVVLVAATGNDNTDQPGYPAAYPEVLGVSATDGNLRLADFSNYGDYVDVVAPGVSIASTYPGSQYAALSGTSMASPHAAALAALIRSVHPLLRNTEVMDIMRRTAADLGKPGKDPLYGYGQIDVAAALKEAARLKQSIGFYPEWVRREIEQWRSREASGG
jgi:subtilisin family serine protease